MSSGDPSFIPDNSDDDNAGSAGSNRATRRLLLAAVGNAASKSWFDRHDGPTLLVAAAIYASWLFLLASHRYVPWWGNYFVRNTLKKSLHAAARS